MEEAQEQETIARSEVAMGNPINKTYCRAKASGLRRAASIVADEIEFQRIGEEIDNKPLEEIRADLHAAGYTDEDLERFVNRCREVAERAIASGSNDSDEPIPATNNQPKGN